jgi:pimeloyl-ACP methyl ester carboxylesterase
VKLTMPVLAVGGEKSFGPLQAVIMRHVATNVRGVVVAGSGHWLMEERPAESDWCASKDGVRSPGGLV